MMHGRAQFLCRWQKMVEMASPAGRVIFAVPEAFHLRPIEDRLVLIRPRSRDALTGFEVHIAVNTRITSGVSIERTSIAPMAGEAWSAML